MYGELPPVRRADPLVTWRFAAAAAQLAEWERSPEDVSIPVDYRVSDAPADAWWRVQVVTYRWLRGMLALPYTARPQPALLIIPDGSLAERRTAITRLLSPESALDLSRVAERVPVPEAPPASASGPDLRA